MAYTQTSHAGSMEQVIRMLASMAQAPAYTTEVQGLKAGLDPGGLTLQIVDANGLVSVIDLDDVSLPDLTWVDESFAAVITAEGVRIEPPYPKLQIIARSGGLQADDHGVVFRDDRVQGQIYHVDATVIVNKDIPTYADRAAVIMARAFERLVRRNETLGGLVQLIQPRGPIEVETQTAKPGDVAAARSALEVYVLAD